MKLRTLALDYDGTIAEDGRLAPGMWDAIQHARAAGLTVMIVTGRIIGDLRRLVGDLTFVDAIVGENGAVITFPRIGRSTALHHAPAPEFLEGLTRQGVVFRTGRTVVEADVSAAPIALDLIRQMEQPLVMHFNRGRMMILPQAITKATGLAAALETLRLSPHNVLAIGDAENDHDLLRAAEIGVAVEWGSAALRSIADEVLTGEGPAAVAPYIEALVARSGRGEGLRMRHPRRRVVLGTTRSDRELSLGVTGRNVVVSGDPRSGKSWVGGLLCEQLILHGYSVCVVDPEGDYAGLEALPRVTVVGGDDPPPLPHGLLRLLRHPDRSIVLDLSRQSHLEKIDYLRDVLPQIMVVRQRTGLPHRLLIDEAHYFLCEPAAMSLLNLELGGCTVVTYQASRLHPDVLRGADVFLVTRATDPDEVAALAGVSRAAVDLDEWNRVLASLAVDEAALLPGPEEAEGRLRRIRLAARLTPHVRHRMKYLDVPIADHHAFVFSLAGGERVRTLREFVEVLGRTEPERLHDHLQRGDFSKWIAGVFGDRYLATRIRHLEDSYRLDRTSDINDEIISAVRSRYELTGGDTAYGLPEDRDVSGELGRA
jgi:hydroxymethylpyrimidine pyrophosphatase-like HAD family hydrolase